MGRKFLDARPDYSDPLAGYQALNAGDAAAWSKPENGRKAFDAAREWTGPTVGIPLGSLPVGTPGNDTLVKYLTLFGEKIVWRVIGKGLSGMPVNSITLYMNEIVAMRCFDAAEPNNPEMSSEIYGYGDWGVSNLRQWANSHASPGEWFSSQHQYDAPPSERNVEENPLHHRVNPYESEAGMLYESTLHERNLALATDRIYGGGWKGNGTTCTDKFFTLTSNELGIESIKGNGAKIAYFVDAKSRVAQCTAQCIAHSNYTYNPETPTAWSYWTATSTTSYSSNAVCVTSAGSRDVKRAYNGSLGVRLACNLPSDAPVSLEPDEDGCYTVIA